MTKVQLVAFDLDGTLTQHRTPLGKESRQLLDTLRQKYRLLMVGAGACARIYRQMEGYPIDIIGNYGMQFAEYSQGDLNIRRDAVVPAHREEIIRRVTALREKFGYTQFAGETVEFHPSGMLTFPLLGTKADIQDKLAFDPDRVKRRPMYPDVVEAFPEYTVFIGGSSSFDMPPHPYNKRYALERFCAERGISPQEVVFVGDDYGPGGNDEDVYKSDFRFIAVDDYRNVTKIVSRELL